MRALEVAALLLAAFSVGSCLAVLFHMTPFTMLIFLIGGTPAALLAAGTFVTLLRYR